MSSASNSVASVSSGVTLVTSSGDREESSTTLAPPAPLSHVTDHSATDRNATLLSLASSCSLSEILSAQQQALEQIHTQIHLAQQFESITNRLDAIERTLNSLIQQRAVEDHVDAASVTASTPTLLDNPSPGASAVNCITVQTASPVSQNSSSSKKSKKLPRDLCSKIRGLYNSLGLEFNVNERFASPQNQRMTESLIEKITQDHMGLYDPKDIKRAAHRYYESRRRIGIEELPEHKEKAAIQKKKRKYRARQQRCYDRRSRVVRETELQYWTQVTPLCMTEESDDSDTEKIVTHKLVWRSEFLNQFIQKIDGRLEKLRKPGATVNIKRERVEGSASTSRPPYNLPKWMIGPAFHSLLPIMDSMVGSEHSGSNHMEVTDPTVKPESIMSEHGHVDVSGDENTIQFPSIVEVQSVHADDSSDFELPPEMTT